MPVPSVQRLGSLDLQAGRCGPAKTAVRLPSHLNLFLPRLSVYGSFMNTASLLALESGDAPHQTPPILTTRGGGEDSGASRTTIISLFDPSIFFERYAQGLHNSVGGGHNG